VQLILESLRLASMSPAQVRAKGILEGEHHLSDALNRGQGALIVGNHVGNWLFSAAFLSLRGYRVSGVAYEIPIKSIEQHMLGLWRKYDLNVTHVGKGAPAAAVQTFKRNEVFLVLADVSLRPGHGAWFRLGQTAINVDTGPARLALLTNTTILTLSSRRKSDGRYVVSISPEIDRGEFAESPTALTQYWMDVLYREILETPDQWWLMNLVPLKLQRDVILASLAEPKTHWAGISERD
jgi:KDO2-lipid IV(A) lauroyltransferase